jgi:polyphosphate kinase 2 (PPK2 family)
MGETQKLNFYQGKLNKLARHAHQKEISSVLVFEGWDAGGKGGAIRRLTHALDARNYQVIPIGLRLRSSESRILG